MTNYLKITTRTLVWVTRSIGMSSILIRGMFSMWCSSLQKYMTICFVLQALTIMLFSLVHLDTISTDSCNNDTEVAEHISNNVPSSTYLYKGHGV